MLQAQRPGPAVTAVPAHVWGSLRDGRRNLTLRPPVPRPGVLTVPGAMVWMHLLITASRTRQPARPSPNP
ncbi:hypothetical protein B0T16DRAFT_203143 [Cercophora newfieldiana]|uniref:Uncharacterized protein n=1 Tax=Cercophora newfieldiana TaxID=92897 RepID=A0AA40CJN3_9PEZI|nr:hypothetical protein B0T16DRAFT_203143 [Cercophora newfieldiana]